MGEFICNFCGFQYEERNGDPKNGIPKGTLFHELAGSLCNRCGMQGERHERQHSQPYIGLEAEYFDLFTGKVGLKFYKNWLASDASCQVLELGVGTGRVAYELANLGIVVTGIDTSEDMLSIAVKKKKRLSNPSKLILLQENVLNFSLQTKFSHVLLTEGFLQHFLLPEEQLQVLLNVKNHLVNGGLVAIDIFLPPNETKWNYQQCKQWGKKRIYQTIHGQTSLSRQTFETTLTYETYEQNLQQSCFKVDREYSLILPRELGYLLKVEGFEVMGMFENYQPSSHSAASSLMPHLVKNEVELKRDETLDKKLNEHMSKLRPYENDVWANGGYPLQMQGEMMHQPLSSRWTIIAKYTVKEMQE
ncbi:methyltransferase domain-containing protein [Alkalihalobacterium alkalinitrilicum]|uniref:methyltransferase domain-containing protein n=1 Tax=Alkalihalobacterium alkalinitrilicum TaxID=427920 RepID=UPI000994D02A|nr:methyltransferase domain-containing protein [Alkalihalobacterium alkalinitrilicum]